MCGMFASVEVANSIRLPHFPEEIDRDEMMWQSKGGLDVYSGPYRITPEGRLQKREESYIEKSAEEKKAEAEKWGFDSWDAYIDAYESHNPSGAMIPPEVDGDITFDDGTDNPPSILPRSEKLDETWWADQNFHGSFEFHQSIKEDPTEYEILEFDDDTMERPLEHALDVYLEYEARFTKGDLDEILFIGERMGNADDPIESALDKIEDWREWKEENDE